MSFIRFLRKKTKYKKLIVNAQTSTILQDAKMHLFNSPT